MIGDWRGTVERITDRMIKGHDTCWEMDIEHFDWGPGVGLLGIMRAYQVTGKEEYLEYLIRWADRHLREASVRRTVNSAAPCLALWELYRRTGRDEYAKVCYDTAAYLTEQAPLTIDGGLEHTVTEDVPDMKEQLWADTLFMACILPARIGRDAERPWLGSFAAKQLLTHYRFLWDEERSLFFHGWNGLERSNMSAVRWGRANAWVLVSTLDILRTQPEFEGRREIVDRMKRHMSALCRLQREDGMFGTILDDTGSYTETSASAGIAWGLKLAVRLGFGGDEERQAAERVCEALLRHVNADGSVTEVSTGTPVMPDAAAYKTIGRGVTLYGQTLAIMALTEDMV